jgi:hypothetical protein
MATSAQHSDPQAIGSSPYRHSLTSIQEEEKTQRGMRSFLTWSFFLAQIGIAEEALGAFAAAPSPDDPSTMEKAAGPETGAGISAPLVAPIPSQTDTFPQPQAERIADGGRMSASDDAGGGSAPFTPLIGESEASAPRMIAIGGGGGSGSADASDGEAGLAANLGGFSAEGDWIPNIDLNIPGLLGDVIDIADGTLSALTGSLAGDLASDILDTAGQIVSIADEGVDVGLDGGLFIQADIASSQIMLAANLSGDAATGPYPDTLLALTAVSSEDAPGPASAPSFLQSMPLIGDVLHQPQTDMDDHQVPPSQADLMVDITHMLDHAGAKSIGDLWS